MLAVGLVDGGAPVGHGLEKFDDALFEGFLALADEGLVFLVGEMEGGGGLFGADVVADDGEVLQASVFFLFS